MEPITESSILAPFVGKKVDPERLASCARKNRAEANSDEYIIYSAGYLYDPALRERFGVTNKLKDLWERRGTEYNIYLYISGGILLRSKILKYTESGGARPSMAEPKPTQQELRIARRILEFVTR